MVSEDTKKIAILSTGGTIAMQVDATGLANNATLGPKQLLKLANADRDDIEFIEIAYKNVPSPHLQLEDIIELKGIIEKAVNEENVDGVVITHGTDTLQETAYFLDMTLDVNVPVVITGAQRNSSLPMSDAALNIIESIIVASDDRAAEMGVLVVFSSEIIPARDAIKTHKSAVNTFKAIEFGHIGHVSNNRCIWARKPLIRDKYPIGQNITDLKVAIIPAYLGQNSTPIRHAIEDGVNGIVIEGVGAGHSPENMLPGLEEAIAKGVEIVWSSRARKGRMFTDTYGYKGSETYLRDMEIIWGEDLTPDKLRMKLLLLLSNNYSHEQIKYEFEKNFYM